MASEEKNKHLPGKKDPSVNCQRIFRQEIAGILFISEATVVSHRKNLLIKFKVKNTAELIKGIRKLFWLEVKFN